MTDAPEVLEPARAQPDHEAMDDVSEWAQTAFHVIKRLVVLVSGQPDNLETKQ